MLVPDSRGWTRSPPDCPQLRRWRDGALYEVGSQTGRRAEHIQNLFYRCGLLNCRPDEENYIVGVQAALEFYLGRLYSSQDTVPGVLEEEPVQNVHGDDE